MLRNFERKMKLNILLKSFTKVKLTHLFSMRTNEGVNKTIARSITTYYDTKDISLEKEIRTNMLVEEDFLSEHEEMSLFNEVDPYMRRLRYEYDHWDNAIHGFRETERKTWIDENQKILDRVKDIAFPPEVPKLAYVHILDLEKKGYIKPHIDAVRFCGNTIAGLSLLSSSVMRLVHDKDKNRYADILLKRRSLYIMKDAIRYEYSHEILPESESKFKGQIIPKDRRISIILRNEPNVEDTE
ncbi:alpha-ketoglutarate-dependent dioxygenase alkB homolog 7, mitochondrial-like [Mytilus californianus]|uniref:alpha-ketoglutarate-dependent dioxygenase alkB homolog 7, mitochondrial-like n=1 Tax=Mytilus californianus TaxID=6549 RepID=UPI002246E959|nr:alpha-ketoglutarate-dependent dioxygenase alkB homolog 7, mitochondrial-like [Mytilus californianus]